MRLRKWQVCGACAYVGDLLPSCLRLHGFWELGIIMCVMPAKAGKLEQATPRAVYFAQFIVFLHSPFWKVFFIKRDQVTDLSWSICWKAPRFPLPSGGLPRTPLLRKPPVASGAPGIKSVVWKNLILGNPRFPKMQHDQIHFILAVDGNQMSLMFNHTKRSCITRIMTESTSDYSFPQGSVLEFPGEAWLVGCMYTYMHTYTHTYLHMYTHACIQTDRQYTHTYKCIYTHEINYHRRITTSLLLLVAPNPAFTFFLPTDLQPSFPVRLSAEWHSGLGYLGRKGGAQGFVSRLRWSALGPVLSSVYRLVPLLPPLGEESGCARSERSMSLTTSHS